MALLGLLGVFIASALAEHPPSAGSNESQTYTYTSPSGTVIHVTIGPCQPAEGGSRQVSMSGTLGAGGMQYPVPTFSQSVPCAPAGQYGVAMLQTAVPCHAQLFDAVWYQAGSEHLGVTLAIRIAPSGSAHMGDTVSFGTIDPITGMAIDLLGTADRAKHKD